MILIFDRAVFTFTSGEQKSIPKDYLIDSKVSEKLLKAADESQQLS
jgi:hypothetical protein